MENGRHGYKMMLLRKKGRKEKNENEEKFDSNGIPYEIFGEGHGLEDLRKLLKTKKMQIQK